MSFTPGPNHTLLMLRLIFGPAEPKLGELKSAALCKQLEAAGLIRLERRARSSHVLVTDKGWQWTQAHLHLSFSPQGAHPGQVLLALLPKLQRFLQKKDAALAELFEPADAGGVSATSESPTRRAHAALLALGGGKTLQRLTMDHARAALPELTADRFDQALLQLQADGSVALYHEDDPDKRRSELEAAAICVAGSRYHLVYLLE